MAIWIPKSLLRESNIEQQLRLTFKLSKNSTSSSSKCILSFHVLNRNLFYPLTIFLQVFLHSCFLHPLTTLQGVRWRWSCLHSHFPIPLALHKATSSIFVLHLPFHINIFEHIISSPLHILIQTFKKHYLKSLTSSKKKNWKKTNWKKLEKKNEIFWKCAMVKTW